MGVSVVGCGQMYLKVSSIRCDFIILADNALFFNIICFFLKSKNKKVKCQLALNLAKATHTNAFCRNIVFCKMINKRFESKKNKQQKEKSKIKNFLGNCLQLLPQMIPRVFCCCFFFFQV